jgi:four helix bundle protein
MSLRHHSLVAWQRADDLFIALHTLTIRTFPRFERYELGSQIRRAAYSVPANIAEGYGRRHWRDRIRFMNIAEASLTEVAYGIHASHRLGYIDEATRDRLDTHAKQVAAPLAGLIRSIQREQRSMRDVDEESG